MLPEVYHHQEGRVFPERKIGPEDLTPAERVLVGSTESATDFHSLVTADNLHSNVDRINSIREQSIISQDERTGLFLPPKQVITAAVANQEATMGFIAQGLIIHAQLPPLDARGRVSGVWELALVKRKGDHDVITDTSAYQKYISQDALAAGVKANFSILHPQEGRPFPRLALSRGRRGRNS